ncbi:Oidioi.mRNA.OKI2018_I69.XSR.g15184.t1.cds [Oikopleura dioica]|uniref:Oidioi.mRNA.OKI2018_I69.XSR.g15184.t1.cds n=1 Tax=Oikopleura dioica TaxID=34765 RepID=A0ABN7SG66_OIKDI|nr:Oidioi.mRNA.OKI2018_I69.XSR.g15184.t1.cds [Oikopleura dioica]
MFVKFNGFEGFPDFQIRMNQMGTGDCDFELSCKCKFRVPDIPLRDATCEGTLMEDIYRGLMTFLACVYKGEIVQREQSLWKDPDFVPAKHLFCPEDEQQVEHVKEFIAKRRAMLMTTGGKEMENCNCCLFGNDTMQTMGRNRLPL